MNPRLFVLALVLPLLAGCIFAVNTGSTTNTPSGAVATPPTTPTVAEINAAAALDVDANRAIALKNIAARSFISSTDQVHLVYTTFRVLHLDSQRQDVISTLIANPSFTADAKTAILNQLGQLAQDNTRMAILTQLQDRPAQLATPKAP